MWYVRTCIFLPQALSIAVTGHALGGRWLLTNMFMMIIDQTFCCAIAPECFDGSRAQAYEKFLKLMSAMSKGTTLPEVCQPLDFLILRVASAAFKTPIAVLGEAGPGNRLSWQIFYPFSNREPCISRLVPTDPCLYLVKSSTTSTYYLINDMETYSSCWSGNRSLVQSTLMYHLYLFLISKPAVSIFNEPTGIRRIALTSVIVWHIFLPFKTRVYVRSSIFKPLTCSRKVHVFLILRVFSRLIFFMQNS